MRRASLIAIPLVLATAACSGHKDDKAANAVAPAGFVPPTALNRTDFVSILDRHFTQYDLNHDSILQASEVPERHHDRILSFDANHDGEITLDEFEKGGLARFDEADRNQDQVLTGEERRSALGTDTDDDAAGNQSAAAKP
jgi:hypothetical protein